MWELIIDGPIDGISNMAIDAALLDEVDSSSDLRTIVRFYGWVRPTVSLGRNQTIRSEEHTSELQSHSELVCRLLLEKKKNKKNTPLKNKKIETTLSKIRYYVVT